MHQGCLRYGQSQTHLDARARPVAQAQHRPILLSANYRNPMPAKVLAKQPIATQKLVHPQKAVTSPRGTLLPREVTQPEDRVPRSPSSVSSMPSASMKAGRSGYHSPQEMHPEVLSTVARREAVVESHERISGSSPSHLTSTCSTSASSLPLGSLREKLRELLPKDLQQDTPSAKTMAEPNTGAVPGVGEVQMELRKEQTSREALEHKVLDLEARLNHALTSMSQVTEARHATDSATDAMLNALRRGVEEISDRCGTLEAQKENGEGTTLERFRETEAKFNEMLRKMEVTLNSEDTCQDLVVAVKTLQSQFQILQAEKRQVAEGLNAMGQKQQLIEQMQLEIREKMGQQVAPVAHLQQMESTLTQLQGQQRELSASVQGLLNMYQACPEHVGSMDKVAVAALLQPIQQTQQQQAQELSNFKVMLEEMKGENSEAKAARREVATVADALSMLCSKVDELSNATNDTVDLGALSKSLAALTERVEQMEGKGGTVTVEAAAPTPSSASSSRGALAPRVPSPRRWLQEPLFVSVGRKSDVPGILQSTDQLLSRPSTSVLR